MSLLMTLTDFQGHFKIHRPIIFLFVAVEWFICLCSTSLVPFHVSPSYECTCII